MRHRCKGLRGMLRSREDIAHDVNPLAGHPGWPHGWARLPYALVVSLASRVRRLGLHLFTPMKLENGGTT